MTRFATAVPLLAAVACAGNAVANTVTVAVASNFAPPLQAIERAFAAETGHRVRIVAGSTGKLYAQIVNGAPYDVFLAADTERPDRLLAAGRAVAGSEFVYAEGVLVLWSPRRRGSLACLLQLHQLQFRHFAIASEELAPYGRAAREWLVHRGIWDIVGHRIVRGENIGQAYHFVASGNAELGLVANAQLVGSDKDGCRYSVPQGFHEPILQKAVLLGHGAGNVAALRLMQFLQSDTVAGLIERYGYRQPQAASH